MNSQSNTMPEAFQAQSVAPVRLSTMQLMYWSVRRELWENRSLYVVPLALAGIYLFGFLISLPHLPAKMRALSTLDPAQQHKAIVMPYHLVAGLMMVTAMIVGAFYCLDALHGERRDRSILFWKSLPVSDLATVLSKAAIPILVLQLLAFAITVALQWIMLLLSSAVLMGNGLSVTRLWTEVSFAQMSLLLLYHLMTMHSLSHAPFYAWLLLVSGWARRAAFLWAVLPVVAIAIIEKVAFNTWHFLNLLDNQLSASDTAAITAGGGMPLDSMTHLTPGTFLTSPGLWIGLLITAAFLAAAVRLRRYQGPI